MSDLVTTESKLKIFSCCQCRILFAVPLSFDLSRQSDPDKKIHCPNAHVLSYPVKSKEQVEEERDTLKKENEALKKENLKLRSEIDQMSAKLAEQTK